jgi:Zn-dependent peptidase ImmA (M78 family)
MDLESTPEWLSMKRRHPSAQTLLDQYGLLEPPFDVMALAERMGVRVSLMPGYQWAGSVVSRLSPPQATITYRAEDKYERQRFTVAHEIGHLMLHPVGEEFRDASFKGDIREAQANGYAANLLMPERVVYRYARFHRMTLDDMADCFEVSHAAMKIRLAKLGLL